jgi:hypothetical protein
MTSIDRYPVTLQRKYQRMRKREEVEHGTTLPIEVFYKILERGAFESLLGYTIPPEFDGDDHSRLKSIEKKNKTHFYRYHDKRTGSGAIVYIPRHQYFHTRVFIKCL